MTVATLTNATAGAGYPQSPARVSIGIWCPGCNGEYSAAYGAPVTNDLDDYFVTLSALEVINYNPTSQYTFADMSGTASSVVISNASTSKLTSGAIVGIGVGALAAIVIIVGALIYWLRVRKTKRVALDPGETLEIPGARTNYPEIVVDKNFSTTEEPIVTIRYPENEELHGLNREIEPGAQLGQPLRNRSEERLDQPSESEMQECIGEELRLGGRLGTSLRTFMSY